ncbi:MAG: BamA/TamA family outer membrane protein [Nannocystaceae bacterium]
MDPRTRRRRRRVVRIAAIAWIAAVAWSTEGKAAPPRAEPLTAEDVAAAREAAATPDESIPDGVTVDATEPLAPEDVATARVVDVALAVEGPAPAPEGPAIEETAALAKPRKSAVKPEAPDADDNSKQGKQGKKEAEEEKNPKRLEFGVLPALNYDSDLGFGFGLIGTLAKFYPGYVPYRWRIELLLYATVRPAPGGGAQFPYHEDYIDTDFPGLFNNRLRIRATLSFNRFSTASYYGVGNASPLQEPWKAIDPDEEPDQYKAARRFNQYDRIYPRVRFIARVNVWDRSIPAHKRRLEVFTGTSISYNILNYYTEPGSKIVEDIAQIEEGGPDGETLEALIHGTQNHALLQLLGGLLLDTRDHEFTPTRGTFTELSLRVSPGVEERLQYAGFLLWSSWYQSLYKEYLVLAVRGLGDLLVGRPPFYELSQYGAFQTRSGPGGSWSVRGVPRQRYHGKIKAIGNLELRSFFARFKIKKQRFAVGLIAFVDTGRVWADYKRTVLNGESVDGSFGDWKLGLGGGLRIKWGETFVIRVDPSYSLTDKNFGLYIDIGNVF